MHMNGFRPHRPLYPASQATHFLPNPSFHRSYLEGQTYLYGHKIVGYARNCIICF